jgi:hypothetical protein
MKNHGAKDATHPQWGAPLAVFPGLGLVSAVTAVHSLLKERLDQLASRFEHGRAQENLHLRGRLPIDLAGLKALDQLADFRFLGEEDRLGREVAGVANFFFFESSSRCRRDCSLTTCTY